MKGLDIVILCLGHLISPRGDNLCVISGEGVIILLNHYKLECTGLYWIVLDIETRCTNEKLSHDAWNLWPYKGFM